MIQLTETCYEHDWHRASVVDALIAQGLSRDDAESYTAFAFADRGGEPEAEQHLTDAQLEALESGELPRARRIKLIKVLTSSAAWIIRGELYSWSTDAASGLAHAVDTDELLKRLIAEREWEHGAERSGAWLLVRGRESGAEMQIGLVP